MIDIAGSKSTTKFVTQESVYGSSYEDIPRRVPDASRMENILGVHATTSLREGLTRTIEWFRTTQQ
jgi:UDP-glucose 4-epimerase